MRPVACYIISMLTVTHCTEPNQSGMLKNLLKKVVNLKIVMTQKKLTTILLERLIRAEIGTNEVEQCSRRIQEGGGRMMEERKREMKRKQFVVREMNVKLKDAKVEKIKAENKAKKTEDYMKRRILQWPQLLQGVLKVMQEEVTLTWDDGKKKMIEKIGHRLARG